MKARAGAWAEKGGENGLPVGVGRGEAGKKSLCASDPHPHLRPSSAGARSPCSCLPLPPPITARAPAAGSPEPAAWVSDHRALSSAHSPEQGGRGCPRRRTSAGRERRAPLQPYFSGRCPVSLAVLISQGPRTGMIYSLPDISPSSAEKFIPGLTRMRSRSAGTRPIPAPLIPAATHPPHWGHGMSYASRQLYRRLLKLIYKPFCHTFLLHLGFIFVIFYF